MKRAASGCGTEGAGGGGDRPNPKPGHGVRNVRRFIEREWALATSGGQYSVGVGQAGALLRSIVCELLVNGAGGVHRRATYLRFAPESDCIKFSGVELEELFEVIGHATKWYHDTSTGAYRFYQVRPLVEGWVPHDDHSVLHIDSLMSYRMRDLCESDVGDTFELTRNHIAMQFAVRDAYIELTQFIVYRSICRAAIE
jgi:hypothetical protein